MVTTSTPHRRGRSRFTAAVTSAVVVSAGAALGVVAGTPPAAAATTVFTYTGGEQTYVVPAGVYALYITAVGANGGRGAPYGAGWHYGGEGAEVVGSVPVVPGETLYVEVGGAGSDGGDGGFNGGGRGVAGGGGGASDVRTRPRSAELTTMDSRLLVAGGGGGGAYGWGGSAGYDTIVGAGDGGKGQVVADSEKVEMDGGNGGLGAPAGNGGRGKLGPNGDDGTLGVGGESSWMSGGGGGGGYYGGGGGGGGPAGGAGGAGSSYWVPTVSGSLWWASGAPRVEISTVPNAMVTASLLKADVEALDLPRGIETKLRARVAEIRAAVAAGELDMPDSLTSLRDTVDSLTGNVLRHSDVQALRARITTLLGFYTP